MDDDVKNLFQKFGQTTDAYREINRDADSEQAKKRWPLLRDVHLHSGPAPVRVAQHREEELAAPVQMNDSSFRSSAVKATMTKSAAVKTSPLQAASEVHVSVKHNSQLPLKQMLMQKAEVAEQESEAETAPPFLSRILPASPKPSVANQKESAGSGLFSSRAQANPAREAETPAHVPGVASVTSVRKSLSASSVAPSATFIHNIPAAHAMPTAQTQTQTQAEALCNQSVKTKPATKDHPVSAVFGRLAGKQEEARPADAGSNSFFKKIFKP
ncbi:cellulose biosynthesis protein BcsP [Undibacterium sp. Ji42W]|uniref:cellulose biosynthesis protein BcsP n=1 Tax=Undibacterium sp. Ji42W TaxID=3413039 RepID=UPI003BF288B5